MTKTLNMLSQLCNFLPGPAEQRQAQYLISQIREHLRTQEASAETDALRAKVVDLTTQLRTAKGQVTRLKKKVEKLSEDKSE